MQDLCDRLSADESLSVLMHDMHYGVAAEAEEFIAKLLSQIQSQMEKMMEISSKDVTVTCSKIVGCSTSPEPSKTIPFFREGVFSSKAANGCDARNFRA